MASGLSETAIFNMVLDRLVEESLLGTTDEKAVARWLTRNYPVQRDVLLQRHTWNFALKRAVLSEDVAKPAFEWGHSYTMPSDCIRVLPLTSDGRRNSPMVPFVVEGTKILTDMSAPLRMRYISRVTNPAYFTPIFANLLAQILAANAAHWVTGKANLTKFLSDTLPSMTADAQLLDSLEGLPEEPEDSDVLNVR